MHKLWNSPEFLYQARWKHVHLLPSSHTQNQPNNKKQESKKKVQQVGYIVIQRGLQFEINLKMEAVD